MSHPQGPRATFKLRREHSPSGSPTSKIGADLTFNTPTLPTASFIRWCRWQKGVLAVHNQHSTNIVRLEFRTQTNKDDLKELILKVIERASQRQRCVFEVKDNGWHMPDPHEEWARSRRWNPPFSWDRSSSTASANRREGTATASVRCSLKRKLWRKRLKNRWIKWRYHQLKPACQNVYWSLTGGNRPRRSTE